jgi:hypothetical protein
MRFAEHHTQATRLQALEHQVSCAFLAGQHACPDGAPVRHMAAGTAPTQAWTASTARRPLAAHRLRTLRHKAPSWTCRTGTRRSGRRARSWAAALRARRPKPTGGWARLRFAGVPAAQFAACFQASQFACIGGYAARRPLGQRRTPHGARLVCAHLVPLGDAADALEPQATADAAAKLVARRAHASAWSAPVCSCLALGQVCLCCCCGHGYHIPALAPTSEQPRLWSLPLTLPDQLVNRG